jgi:flagellar protein FliO/FliZ
LFDVLCSGTSPAWAADKTIGSNALGNPVGAIVGLIFALLLILALIVLTIRFLASKGQVDVRGGIRILAARQIAPNRSVQIISVGHRQFLIGVGEQVSVLAEVSDSDLSESSTGTLAPSSLGRTLAWALHESRQRFGKLGREQLMPGANQKAERREETHVQ